MRGFQFQRIVLVNSSFEDSGFVVSFFGLNILINNEIYHLSFTSAHNNINAEDLVFFECKFFHFVIQALFGKNDVVSVDNVLFHLVGQNGFNGVNLIFCCDFVDGFGNFSVLLKIINFFLTREITFFPGFKSR